ncbi:MAG: PTS sugar transporter subunit IIA [Vibrio sp.]
MSICHLIGHDNIIISAQELLSVNAAIELTCSTLLAQGKIEASYLKAIQDKHQEIGAFYVLAPKIAMPHARPEDGVNEPSLQLTVFKHGVDFESAENGPVYLAITLAATDSNSHIETIVALSKLFQNDDDIDAIIQAESKHEIVDILKKY